MPSTIDDLARTRSAFETWRSSHQGRRRIPDHLSSEALALLDRYSISRVAHELRLDPKQLRQRKLSAAQPLVPDIARGPHFVQMHGADLGIGTSAPRAETDSHHYATETGMRLIFKRTDGSRLTLCLPAADWSQIAMLCANFMREGIVNLTMRACNKSDLGA